MKHLTVLLLSFVVLLSSCNRNNDEPSTEILLPIAEAYLPVTVPFNINDTEWTEQIAPWNNKKIVVKDLSELPDDPMGFSNAYNGIDFDKYSLLIAYDIHNWEIDTYRNRFYRNTIENSYNWAICMKTSTVPDSNAEQWYFSRYAILINKLPENADIKIWISLGALNWGWD